MYLLSHPLLLGIAALLATIRMSEACSCLRGHPQQLFCNADVVIRVKVINKTVHNADSIDAEVQYGIKLIKMFKGFDKITEVHAVYTAQESATCGVSLDAGGKQEYLLTGYVRNNKVTIGLCGLNARWQDVTAFQVKSLTDGTYTKGCACKIKICSGDQCDNHDRKACFWDDWGDGHQQLEENSACVPGKYGSCSWQSSPDAKPPIYEGHP